jgi:protein-L-isoaspartate(D-aspartate) O-methyltransferase
MDPATLRADMVDSLEHALGGVSGTVAGAMRAVPRHEFVAERPYDNRDAEQAGTRVLAPTTVARLLDALDPEPGDETLVVGAGVGYTAAVVAEVVGDRHVHAVDISRPVVLEARRNLERAGYGAVLVDCRDGAGGLPEYAPFDRVLVEAAAVRPPRGPADDDVEVVERFGPVAFDPLLVDGEQAGGGTRNRTEREDREFAEQGYFASTGWELEWIDWDDRLDGGRGHRRR